jgi:hypothetical protein
VVESGDFKHEKEKNIFLQLYLIVTMSTIRQSVVLSPPKAVSRHSSTTCGRTR